MNKLESAEIHFYFLAWSQLAEDRANTVMILKTCDALARRNPGWRVHLRFSELPEDVDGLMRGFGITRPDNLDVGRLFPIGPEGGLTHKQIGLVMSARPSKTSERHAGACRRYWLDHLGEGPAVIYTRNMRLIEYFRALDAPGVPLILELHQLKHLNGIRLKGGDRSLGAHKDALRIARDAEFAMLRQADLVFCISGTMARRIQRFAPAISTRLLRSATELPKGAVHSKVAGGGTRDIDLLYTGQLYTWKGVDTIVEALRHLPTETRLTVIGGNDLQQLYVMKKFAQNLGVAERIDWLGQMPHREVMQYQLRAKIGLAPLPREYRISRWYTSPIKVFELMAAGATLLVADLPSMRDILEPGRTAEFARPGDARDWAAKIAGLLKDDRRRQSLAREAALQVRSYTFEARADLIREAVLERLQSRAERGARSVEMTK